MPVTVIVGAQWGDEGKGRVVDWLAQDADGVARYAGGDNAGHTVIVGDKTFKLHLIPSGAIRPGVRCILGSGMVINPVRFLEELDMLAGMGVDIAPERIHISSRAHIITPGHLALDGASEQDLGDESIGTTRRGIGLAYTDKATRVGVLVGEMRDPEQFADAIKQALERTNFMLTQRYGLPPINEIDDLAGQYAAAAQRIKPYITNTTTILHNMLEAGQRIVAEGAQATLLDIDHGHYPYLTSSSATVGGALTGLGFGPQVVDRVLGVVKAYCTRVGNGPFPTELVNPLGDRLRENGAEFGTTTGRPRRCGWLDAVAMRYAVRVNGMTEIAVSKLDVLSGFETLHIATAYDLDGERLDAMPIDTAEIERVTPIYETLPGWAEDISTARQWADLPDTARSYIERIEALAGVPVLLVSVGPEREQLIVR